MVLFIGVVELTMTLNFIRAVGNHPQIRLNEWFVIGLKIEYLVFFIPSRVLLLYSSFRDPIMKAFYNRSKILIGLG